MDWHAGGLVDDNDVVVLMDDADRLGSDGGLVPVQGVRDDIAVLQSCGGGGNSLTIDDDGPSFNGILLQRGLGLIAYKQRIGIRSGRGTYIVCCRPVSEFARKDI